VKKYSGGGKRDSTLLGIFLKGSMAWSSGVGVGVLAHATR
jgi:hypothetical protein